jgi:hypothetical protein
MHWLSAQARQRQGRHERLPGGCQDDTHLPAALAQAADEADEAAAGEAVARDDGEIPPLFQVDFIVDEQAEKDKDLSRLALSLGVTLAFVATFSATWGVVTWVVAAELAPMRWHAGALALATATNWLCNAAVAHFAQLVSQSVAFASFGMCSVLAAIYVQQYLPETAGASLENVGVLWAARILHQDPEQPARSRFIFRLLRQLGGRSVLSGCRDVERLQVGASETRHRGAANRQVKLFQQFTSG